jgi:hypothetical protein
VWRTGRPQPRRTFTVFMPRVVSLLVEREGEFKDEDTRMGAMVNVRGVPPLG